VIRPHPKRVKSQLGAGVSDSPKLRRGSGSPSSIRTGLGPRPNPSGDDFGELAGPRWAVGRDPGDEISVIATPVGSGRNSSMDLVVRRGGRRRTHPLASAGFCWLLRRPGLGRSRSSSGSPHTTGTPRTRSGVPCPGSSAAQDRRLPGPVRWSDLTKRSRGGHDAIWCRGVGRPRVS
jgi:hypothetical protein